MKLNDFEEDPLWDLLGKLDEAKPVEVSPLFARNVLREIRLAQVEKQQKRPTFLGLLFGWRTGAVGAVVLTLIAMDGSLFFSSQIKSLTLASQRHIEVETIQNLDELLAEDDTAVWTDKNVF